MFKSIIPQPSKLKKIRIGIVNNNQYLNFAAVILDVFPMIKAVPMCIVKSKYTVIKKEIHTEMTAEEFTRKKASGEFCVISDLEDTWKAISHSDCDITKESKLVALTKRGAVEFLKHYPDAVIISIDEEKPKNFDQSKQNWYEFRSDDSQQCAADIFSTISTEMKKITITVAGLAGVGKGYIATEIAAAQGGITVDTGIFYRAIVWHFAIKEKISPTDPKLPQLLQDYMNNFKIEDYSSSEIVKILRSEQVNSIILQWSSNLLVREVAFWLQMKAVHGSEKNVVVIDGRDPARWFRKGPFGFLVICDVALCAERRVKQYKEQGIDCEYEEVLESLIERNNGDRERLNKSNAMVSEGWLLELDNNKDRFSCISTANNKIEPLKTKWETELVTNLKFYRSNVYD